MFFSFFKICWFLWELSLIVCVDLYIANMVIVLNLKLELYGQNKALNTLYLLCNYSCRGRLGKVSSEFGRSSKDLGRGTDDFGQGHAQLQILQPLKYPMQKKQSVTKRPTGLRTDGRTNQPTNQHGDL